VVLIDVSGVELTAALNMTSSSDAAEVLTDGTEKVDRLAGELDSLDPADVELKEESEYVELGKTTPLVSRFSTSLSIEVLALLNKITLAEMEPLTCQRDYVTVTP
jgi:hypothetical protein